MYMLGEIFIKIDQFIFPLHLLKMDQYSSTVEFVLNLLKSSIQDTTKMISIEGKDYGTKQYEAFKKVCDLLKGDIKGKNAIVATTLPLDNEFADWFYWPYKDVMF